MFDLFSTKAIAGNVVISVLVEIIVVIAVSRLMGWIFTKLQQPLVIGEIVAGIMLGPSLLGLIAPSVATAIFPDASIPFLNVLAQIGLIFFMFLIGLELNPKHLTGQLDIAVLISHVSILVPFGMGSILALLLYPQVGIAGVDFTAFSLFLGAAMSITAFPVLARIITENNLQNTKLGTLALTCAAVDDVTAWCLLALAIAVAKTNSFVGAIPTVILSIIFILFMATFVRRMLKRIETKYEEQGKLSQAMLAAIMSGIVICALITELIGIHFIFGAFLLGAVMPKNGGLVRDIAQKMEDFVVIFLLPLFFAYSGLRTQIGLIDQPRWWVLTFIVLAVAISGKYIGTYIAARAVGVDNREASALGWLMNTRGLTELIVLNIGLSLNVISPVLFTMLVIMALVTTFMTSPLLEMIYPKRLIAQDVVESDTDAAPALVTRITNQSLESATDEGFYKIVVPVANPFAQQSVLSLSVSIANTQEDCSNALYCNFVSLCPVNLFESEGGRWGFLEAQLENSTAVNDREDRLITIMERLKPYSHVNVTPIIHRTSDVANSVIKLSQRASLVLLSWQKSAFTKDKLSKSLNNIIKKTPADLAILISSEEASSKPMQAHNLVVPYNCSPHDDLALELALRLLINRASTKLTIFGLVPQIEPFVLSNDLAYIVANLPTDLRNRIVIEPKRANEMRPDILALEQKDTLVIAGLSSSWGEGCNLGHLVDDLTKEMQAPILVVRRFSRSSIHIANLLNNTQRTSVLV